MRLIEEVFIKAKEDTICQTCGIDIPKGTNHLLETYVNRGNLITNHYCQEKKCNPPNNVRLNLIRWGSSLLLLSVMLYLFLTESFPI